MLKFLTMLLVLGAMALAFTPWQALRGDLTRVQGKVVSSDPATFSITVLDQASQKSYAMHLNRDAFEPGQSWKNLRAKPEVEVVATSNLDGSLQARRLQPVQSLGYSTGSNRENSPF